MKKWFVVRQGASTQHSFQHSDVDPKVRPYGKGEYLTKVVYSAEVPKSLGLSHAIRLYKSGVRAKVPEGKSSRRLKPLGEILRLKRQHRQKGQGFVQNDQLYYEPE